MGGTRKSKQQLHEKYILVIQFLKDNFQAENDLVFFTLLTAEISKNNKKLCNYVDNDTFI